MSETEEGEGNYCDDDNDGWGDLISTPNRLICDDFFVLKSEKMENCEAKEVVEESRVYMDDKDEDAATADGKVRGKRVGVAERRAAECGSGGDVSRIDVAAVSSQSAAWSQLLTIPSGISPASLLDAPVMLPNHQTSPTTGTLSFLPLDHESLEMNSTVEERGCDISSSFTLRPHGDSLLWPCISDVQNQQPMASEEFPGLLHKETVPKNHTTDFNSSEHFKELKSMMIQSANDTKMPSDVEDTKRRLLLDGYQKETCLPSVRNSEDGYNWRKYGQKQVKGSEYPRSYYKCTHPNCQVKKKVERSHDGHITEIIYKGAHNHQIPHLAQQRNIVGSPASAEANGSHVKVEEGEIWRNIHTGCVDYNNNVGADGLERSSSTSVLTDNSDLISTTQGKPMGIFDSAVNTEFSSSNNNGDGNEDGTHIGTPSPGDDADEDKSDLKRRKKGNFLLETSLVSRAMREPRVVVQIESDVDILDDGYRWRKYGQKVVKGNPNPRSYYKCTSAGCPVRKHVERASDDLKAVLTTYEGKHNHEVPAARNSIHANMDVSTAHPNLPLSRLTSLPKSEPQVQDLPLRKFTNDYMQSNFVANFDTEPTKFETSPMYPMKFMPFQSSIPFGTVVPDFPISLPPSPNMFGFNNHGKRVVGGQNNGRFLKPKLEHDDASFYDTLLPITDASSRYCPVIPKFP